MQLEHVFLMIAAAAVLALIIHRPASGATPANPRRVMRHINRRRRDMGQPALYLGDPTMPKGWTCNDVRTQEWRAKL